MAHDERRPLEEQLAGSIRELGAVGERAGHQFAQVHGLYWSDFRALILIGTADQADQRLTAGELAQQLSLSSGAVTYLVERLSSSGHVVREGDPKDRRKVLLSRSAEGDALARAFHAPMAALSSVALSDFTDDDLRTAVAVLDRVSRATATFERELGSGLGEPAGRSLPRRRNSEAQGS